MILDKSFIQAESKDCRRLQHLKDAGCVFVLIDTLIYELCTDSKNTQWPATQRKLFAFADRIEVWRHTDELLSMEVSAQSPTTSPIDEDATNGVRAWFQSRKVYVPSDLESICAPAKQQRELDSVETLITECLDLCRVDPTYTAKIQSAGASANPIIADLMQRPDFTEFLIKRQYGNQADQYWYVKGAEHGLGSEWFAYHSARSRLALYCVFMSK